jgi:hypothetical protein
MNNLSPNDFSYGSTSSGSNFPISMEGKRKQSICSSIPKSPVPIQCHRCQKEYKSLNCLQKHLWEHTEYWNTNLNISKHQQVQLLEAASVLYKFQGKDTSDDLMFSFDM